MRNVHGFVVLTIIAGLIFSRRSAAQAPTIGTELPQQSAGAPGSTNSMFGPVPGSGAGTFASPAVGGGQILGGRPGTATPRVPTSISNPSSGNTLTPPTVSPLPAAPPLTQVPQYGTLELPTGADEGPPEGLTVDQAINLLIRDNLDLKARAYEIPSAQADVLTASLRGNPIFYADSQLNPYGSYSTKRQGGPAQYDVNVSQPIDYARKRAMRVSVALATKHAVELQYQDAVRIQISNMENAYVSVLAARETLRYAEAGLAGLDRILLATRRLQKAGNRFSSDVGLLEAQRGAAEIGVMDARESLRKAKLTLGSYLSLPPIQAEALELRDSLRDVAPPPPPDDQLYEMALSCRPDVRAYKVGVEVAQETYRLQKRNQFADAYLLYQPYTTQNLAYLGHDTYGTSWAIGVTLPLPVFNRNQGNIERGRLNIEQSRIQLDAVKLEVVKQVRDAEREYATTKGFLEQFEQKVLPFARKAMADSEKVFLAGETDVIPFLNAQQKYNDLLRQYRDTAVRHRRSMFGLNTVVGSQILP
jgi:cobalt-zinc-cadmium efflux system outer membrane protein